MLRSSTRKGPKRRHEKSQMCAIHLSTELPFQPAILFPGSSLYEIYRRRNHKKEVIEAKLWPKFFKKINLMITMKTSLEFLEFFLSLEKSVISICLDFKSWGLFP
jgi:hypothetical protein